MAKDIGPKIGIDGESEYRKAISDIIQQAKTLDSEMKLVASSFDSSTSAEEKNAATKKVLLKQIETQEDRIKLLREQYERAAETLGENDTKTLQWKQALNEAETGLNKMNHQLEEATEDTDENSEALEDNADASEDAGNGIKKFGEVAASACKAAVAAIAAVGTAVVASGKAVWSAANDIADAGDEIQKNSQKVGLSYESYQKWDYAMKIAGTSMSNCSTGLKTLTNTFDDAQNGSAGAVAKFERLGLSIDDLEGKSREDIFAATITALQGIESDTEKAAIANDLFGKSGQDLLPLLNQTAEATAEVMAEAEKYGMVMGDDAVDASATFKDSLTRLQGACKGLKNNLIGSFLPGITEVMDGIAMMASGQDGFSEKIASGIDSVVESFNELAPKLIDVVMRLSSELLKAAPGLISSVVNGITTNLPQVGSAAVSIIGSLVKSLTDNLPKISRSALDIAMELIHSLTSNNTLVNLVKAALEIIVTLANGLTAALPELIPTIVSVALEIVDTLTAPEQLNMLINTSLQLVLALLEGVTKALPLIVAAMPEVIENVVIGIGSALPSVFVAGKDIVIELVSGSREVLVIIFTMAHDAVKEFVDGINDKIDDIKEIGRSVMSGFVEGLKDKWSWLEDGVGWVVDQVKNKFSGKKGFDVNSPSKWGEHLFEYVMEGMALGTKDGTPELLREAQKSVDAVKNRMSDLTDQAITMSIGTIDADLRYDIDKYGKITAADLRLADQLHDLGDIIRATFSKPLAVSAPAAPVAPVSAAATMAASTSTTQNIGDITVNITPADATDPEEIADVVIDRMQDIINRKAAVYA